MAAELIAGALRSEKPVHEERKVQEFLATYPIAWADQQTLHHFATVKCDVEREGTPIGAHDVWIAAFARQYDLAISTSDTDFKRVPGLTIESW